MTRAISRFSHLLLLAFMVSGYSDLLAETNRVDLYYSPTCGHCRTIADQFLPAMQIKYPGLFEVNLIDITQPENRARLMAIEKAFGFEYQPPTLIIGTAILIGEEQIKAEFESVLQNLSLLQGSTAPLSSQSSPTRGNQAGNLNTTTLLKEKFSSFSFFAIVTAGLLDGINPCAFTTIVFFISFLGFAGYQQRQIQWIGTFFILAVFLTYLAIGFGLLRFLHTLTLFPILSKGLFWLTAVLTALLALLSLRDFWTYRKTGQATDLFLQLPLSIKQRIHRVIGEGYRKNEKMTPSSSMLKLIATACITGFLVSSLESVCTGQLYVPTLVYMTRLEETVLKAWGYLLLYNGAFILPLVVVFSLSLFGMTSQQFARWGTKHLGTVKLGTALFFLVMTALLVKLTL